MLQIEIRSPALEKEVNALISAGLYKAGVSRIRSLHTEKNKTEA